MLFFGVQHFFIVHQFVRNMMLIFLLLSIVVMQSVLLMLRKQTFHAFACYCDICVGLSFYCIETYKESNAAWGKVPLPNTLKELELITSLTN